MSKCRAVFEGDDPIMEPVAKRNEGPFAKIRRHLVQWSGPFSTITRPKIWKRPTVRLKNLKTIRRSAIYWKRWMCVKFIGGPRSNQLDRLHAVFAKWWFATGHFWWRGHRVLQSDISSGQEGWPFWVVESEWTTLPQYCLCSQGHTGDLCFVRCERKSVFHCWKHGPRPQYKAFWQLHTLFFARPCMEQAPAAPVLTTLVMKVAVSHSSRLQEFSRPTRIQSVPGGSVWVLSAGVCLVQWKVKKKFGSVLARK